MVKTGVPLLLVLVVLWGCSGVTGAESVRPNIVMIFIDDMGWEDFSCFGNRDAQTPHVDRLAVEGIRFSQFYVNSPICSPSRCALTTGQYPQRWRITSFLNNRADNARRGVENWLDPQAPTLPRMLSDAGYATGHFGKWHLGGQRDVDDAPPITAYGFDETLTNFEGMGAKLLPLTRKPDDVHGPFWVTKPADVTFDGEDLSPVLRGESTASRMAPLFWRRPPDRKFAYGAGPLPDLAVREGPWKLLCDYDGSRPELYNLAADLGETTNVAEAEPAVVQRLTEALIGWNGTMPADKGPVLGTEALSKPAKTTKKKAP